MVTLDVPFKAEDMEGLMKTILTGRFTPIPSMYSKELSHLVTQMLQLKPKNRPNCDKLLKMPIIQKKIEEMSIAEPRVGNNHAHQEMLATIKMPRKLQYLTDRLPKSNYSLNLSYENPKRSLERPRRA
jgi:NIMA (never in mitosis gene a)-related kinase 1/4/5